MRASALRRPPFGSPGRGRVASEADYNAWLTQAKQKFAIDGSRPANLAAAEQAKQ